MNRVSFVSRALLAVAALALAGCDSEGVRAYAVPKEASPPFLAGGHGPGDGHDHGPGDGHDHGPGDGHDHGPAAPTATGAQWDLPDGWVVDPTPRQMRYATVRAGALEVAISNFPGEAGGLEANVNRWREQIGAERLSGPALSDSLETVVVDGAPAYLVDIRGGERRMLGAILPRGGLTWFVKAAASDADVAPQAAAFQAFVRSLRFVSPEEQAHD